MVRGGMSGKLRLGPGPGQAVSDSDSARKKSRLVTLRASRCQSKGICNACHHHLFCWQQPLQVILFCLSGWSGGGPVLQQFKPYTYNLYTDSCPRANMGDEADRAAQRAAARKAHETNAENQYPKWNEHTDQQFKQLKKQHDKKAYKSDTLEHYLMFTFFPELKKHQSVEEIRRTRTKAPPSAAQAAREAAPRAAAPLCK